VGFTGPGTCIINANQAGGGAFAAATQQQQSFLVTRPLPSATPDTYTTTFNTPLTVAAPGLLSNDSSALSLALTALIDTVPSHGSLTVNSNGSFTYTPNPGYAGVDTFTYKAFDGFASAPVSVSITVAAQPVPASIPTLSQWGLLILSSLIGLLALGRGRVNFLGSRRT
jgi:VCBS repeat-containing protein